MNKILHLKIKLSFNKGSGVNLTKFKYVNNELDLRSYFPARLVKSKGIIEFINAAKILKGKEDLLFVEIILRQKTLSQKN